MHCEQRLSVVGTVGASGLGAITLGIFETRMAAGMAVEVQTSLALQIPFPKCLGTPDDYAKLVQHIIENRMLNGDVIRLDGAIRMSEK